MSGRPTATKCYSTQTCAYAAWEYAVHCLCVYFFLRFAPVLNSPPKLYRMYATQTRSRRGSGLISVVKIARAHFPPFLLGRVCPVPSSRAHNFLGARACVPCLSWRVYLLIMGFLGARALHIHFYVRLPSDRQQQKKHHRIGWVVTVAGSCTPCMAVSIYWRAPLAKSASARI